METSTLLLACLCAAAIGAAVGFFLLFRHEVQQSAAKEPAPAALCMCPGCVHRRGTQIPANVLAGIGVGLSIVRGGAAPAFAMLTDDVGPGGVSRLAVVVVDGSVWDRVAAPAIAEYFNKQGKSGGAHP